ncbi:MAG: hypothetical protein ACR2N9_01670 [Acidimicrobiia bacterium]
MGQDRNNKGSSSKGKNSRDGRSSGKSSSGKGSSSRGSSGKGSSSSGSRSYDSRDPRSRSSSGKGRGSSGSSGSSKSNKPPSGGKKKQYTATTRSVEAQRRENAPQRRRDLKGAAVNLPNWVIESVERTTPRDRIGPTLEELGMASEALAEARYQVAIKHGQRAKSLSPQDPTIRETIALAAYRLGDWGMALNELRAYRRIAGDTTHLPIEMDVLRAQERDADVEKAWQELQRRGGHGLVMNEGTIVYASFLLDRGRVDEAWKVIDPGAITGNPNEGHLRRYFVAARVAAAQGDVAKAKRFSDTIVVADPSFPGYETLEAEIAQAASN